MRSAILNICEGNKDKALIFLRVRNVIIEQLNVDKESVHWNSHISYDLGADELDTIELPLLLDDEFYAELDAELDIPEDMLGSVERWPPSYTWSSSFRAKEPVACTVGELTDFIYNKIK